jgi:hypothetical protein
MKAVVWMRFSGGDPDCTQKVDDMGWHQKESLDPEWGLVQMNQKLHLFACQWSVERQKWGRTVRLSAER